MNVQLNKPSYIAINSLHNTGCGTSNLLVSIFPQTKKTTTKGRKQKMEKQQIRSESDKGRGMLPTTEFQLPPSLCKQVQRSCAHNIRLIGVLKRQQLPAEQP